MKKLMIFLIIIFISKIILCAQTSEPTQIGLNVPNYSTTNLYYINQNPNDYILNVPVFGWMWNSRPAITAMILGNQSHITGSDDFTRFEHSPINSNLTNLIDIPYLMTMSNQYTKDNTNYIRYLNTDHGRVENDGLLLAKSMEN